MLTPSRANRVESPPPPARCDLTGADSMGEGEIPYQRHPVRRRHGEYCRWNAELHVGESHQTDVSVVANLEAMACTVC